MSESETTENDLLWIQANLKAPKGQYNDFAKFHYRSQEDILEALKPLLDERGCILNLSDEMVIIGKGEKARFYVKATATFFDSIGGQCTTTGFAREPEEKKGMDASQITGTSSSYARKYSLNGLFLIDDCKDADAMVDVTEAEIDAFTDLVEREDGIALYAIQINDVGKYQALRKKAAPKGGKTKFVQQVNELVLSVVANASTTAARIVELLDKGDKMGIQEVVDEFEGAEKIIVWRQFSDTQKEDIKDLMSGS